MHVVVCIDWKEQDVLAMTASTEKGEILKVADNWTEKYLGQTYEETFTQDKTGAYLERLNPHNRRSVFTVRLYEQKS